jgi:hypothetical protein
LFGFVIIELFAKNSKKLGSKNSKNELLMSLNAPKLRLQKYTYIILFGLVIVELF